MAMLELDDIHTYYGNIEALKGVSIEVEEGEMVTLIGSHRAAIATLAVSVSPLRSKLCTLRGQEIGETARRHLAWESHSPPRGDMLSADGSRELDLA